MNALIVLGSSAPAAEAAESEDAGGHSHGTALQRARSEGRPRFDELLRAKDALDRMPAAQGAGITAWEWLGPGNIGGRVRAILPLGGPGGNILLGSVVGGIWRFDGEAGTWAPVNDFLPSLAVSSLVQDPNRPGDIYAGTGEGFLVNNARIDGSAGAGVFRSIDGGTTWFPFGGSESWADDPDDKFVNRVATDGRLITLAATNGGIHRSVDWGAFSKVCDGWVTDVKFTADSLGIFGNSAVAGLMTFCDDIRCPTDSPDQEIVCARYSGDGGFSWVESNFFGSPPESLTAEYKPGDPALILSSARPFQPYDILQIGDDPGVRVQVKTRTSNTVLPLLNPSSLPDSFPANTHVRLVPSQRTELAVVAGSPNIVYASMGAGGGTIWKSTDGGANFWFVSNTDHNYLYDGSRTRAFYDTAIWVAPDDPNLIVVAGVEVFRSTNGGVSLERISNGRYVLPAFGQLSPHTDHHVIVAHPNYGPGNSTVYFGNDGGIHKALDITTVEAEAPGNSGWSNLNFNLGITQFYGGAATISPSVQWFMGGGQDNGRPHLRVDNGVALDVNAWQRPFDNDVTDSLGGKGDDKYGVAIDASDPQNPALYAAAVDPRILKSTDAGSTWARVFEPFRRPTGPNDTLPNICEECIGNEAGRSLAPFLLDQVNPNTLLAGAQRIWRTMDAAAVWKPIRDFEGPMGARAKASAIDIAPSDPETYWVGYDNGVLSRTHNGRADPDSVTASWTDVGGSPLPARMITDIAINPTNRDEVFVTFALPDPGNPINTVWYTSNGGLCWEQRTGIPPYELPRIRIHTVRVDPTNPDRVYLGTDLGVLASDDRGLTWNRNPLHTNNEGPANVEVRELLWQGDQNLVAATNGRGMFRAPITPRGPLFDDVSTASGTADTGNSQGAAWGDYDNDGDLDLYVANHTGQPNRMYQNDGAGNFTDVAAAAGTNHSAISVGVAWGDYDNDGDLDLYVVNARTANKLYRNEGNGTFADQSVASGTDDPGNGRGMAWADYDKDGFIDLYVVNVGANKLFHNEGNGTFTDVSAASGTDDAGSGQGVAWGDFSGDGFLDLYVTNWSGQANKLYRNEGEGTFSDRSATSGTAGEESSTGVAWGDFDNDGDLDLYVANEGANNLYRNDGVFPFTDVSFTSGTADTGTGRGVTWVDYDNDGDLDLFVANFLEANKLYRNECCDRFTDVSSMSGVDATSGSRSTPVGDYDADGNPDLYVTSSSANKLYSNFGDAPEGYHWLQIELVGTQSSRNGSGARLRVVSGCANALESQIREISGGSGLYSQNSLTAEFGLSSATVADSLIIEWPSGVVQVFENVALDRKIVIVEDCVSGCLPTGVAVPPDVPVRYVLHVNQPNPFSPATTIRYDLPQPSRVRLRIYNVAGRLVRNLVDDVELDAGRHRAIRRGQDDSGRRAPSGIYFYKLEAGHFRDVRKMVLLR